MNIDTLHYLQTLRQILAPYPFAEEYTCLGTPAFRVKKKLLCRIREDGETLAVHCHNRDKWMEAEPDVFFITAHYLNYSYVLVRLSRVDGGKLRLLLYEAWMQVAQKRMIQEYERQQGNLAGEGL